MAHLLLTVVKGAETTTEKYTVPEGKSLNDALRDFFLGEGDFEHGWVPVGNEKYVRLETVIDVKPRLQ